VGEPRFEAYSERYDHLRMRREDGILEVTMHSDGGSIKWGFEAHEELGYAFAEIGADSENEVIILAGAGEDYLGEEDLTDSPDMDMPELWAKVHHDGKRLLMHHLAIQAPMIAAVQGRCHVHSELAVMCDIVIASEDASFRDAPHFKNGLTPGDGMQLVWPRLLGTNRAKYFLWTMEVIEARKAMDLGVVGEVLPRERLMPRAWELARQILGYPRLARVFGREALNQELKEALLGNLGYGLALEGLGAQIYADPEQHGENHDRLYEG
jgi:enoyl-CoA hydratase/carnithine racemase